MGVSGAVQWWEEWQLRILVLGSLAIQYILLVASFARKFPIRSWFRPVIWLAYLVSDAIAIYGLATLFNRQKKQDGHGDLEVLWAPVLLIHLGGQDGITAYNIEDNELWTRHILTAVSQVTVAIYVFCKSFPSSDRRLLQAAILLFIPGILKCFEKPWALNRASINSLVSSGEPIRRPTDKLVDCPPFNLFVDLASPCTCTDDRIRMRQLFLAVDENYVYPMLQGWLSETFLFLYTKEKMYSRTERLGSKPGYICNALLRLVAMYLPYAAIALFHHSHREAYSEDDVNVTYALLSCTAVLEPFGLVLNNTPRARWLSKKIKPIYHDMVSQYNLIGLLVRNRKHPKMMRIVKVLGCADFLQQHWRMKSCLSSFSITKLVLQYVKDGWKHKIEDVSTYRKFNDNRGQYTLERQGCYQKLGWSLEAAFDESVLLWHLATDFCYYKGASHSHHDSCPHAWCQKAIQCREMSNYMVYLLFVNPEMLLAGSRRNLFTDAYEELEELKGIIIQGDKQPPKERELTQRIIAEVGGGGTGNQHPQGQGGIIRDAWRISKVLSDLPEDKMWTVIEGVWVEMLCFSAARCRGYLHAKGLGTGVEYLTYVWLLLYYMGMETLADKLQRVDHHHHHHHHHKGGEHGDDPSTSRVSRAATAQEEAAGPSRSSGGAADEEHGKGQSAGYHGSDGIVEV